MAVQPIEDDRFISRLRELFSNRYGRELELALTPEGAPDGDAFFNRAVNYNHSMIPWIESVFRMQGARALEIGCGTGAATIAISQKCAEVDAFDIDRQSLEQRSEERRV